MIAPILLCVTVGLLCVTNVVLIVLVALLTRSNDRLMRVISTPYRDQADPVVKAPTHYSMYKVNLPEGNN